MNRPSAPTPSEDAQKLISLYQHHLSQFDRLFKLVGILKRENEHLRNLFLQAFKDNKAPSLPASNYTKPRVTCWPNKHSDDSAQPEKNT